MIFNRPIWAPNVIMVDLPDDGLNDAIPRLMEHIDLPNQIIGVNAISDELEIKERKIIIHHEDYEIYRELPSSNPNPSVSMLKGKAKIVYYVDADKESIKAAFSHMYDLIEDDYPILCLSNDLPKQMQSAITICNDISKFSSLKDNHSIFMTIDQFIESSIVYENKRFQLS